MSSILGIMTGKLGILTLILGICADRFLAVGEGTDGRYALWEAVVPRYGIEIKSPH